MELLGHRLRTTECYSSAPEHFRYSTLHNIRPLTTHPQPSDHNSASRPKLNQPQHQLVIAKPFSVNIIHLTSFLVHITIKQQLPIASF